MTTVPAALERLSDDEWRAVLGGSVSDRVYDGVTLPGFPPAEVQERFVGASFDRALDEAFAFYTTIKQALARHATPLAADSRVLDFGVGWGRILRFFLKDVPAERLYGLDAMPLAIELSRQLDCPGSLIHGDQLPPTIFRENSFDVVYAYSVFSHLAEHAQLAWIEELARVLRPGGLLVVTSRSNYFLDYCASLAAKPAPSHADLAMLRMFPDIEAIRARYAAGEFFFAAYPDGGGGGLDPELYGEAFVPRAYAERMWTRQLELCDFSDDPASLPQSVLVLRKPQARGGRAARALRRIAR